MSDPTGAIDLDQVAFEPPISIPIERLDSAYVGYVLVDALGVRGPGRPPLVAGQVALTETIIDTVRTHAERLGPNQSPLKYVRLKKSKETITPERQEPVAQPLRIAAFEGVSATFSAVKDQFESLVPDRQAFFKQTEEEALASLRKMKIELDVKFRQTLEQMLQDILANANRATLFGCIEKYDGGVGDHSIHIFAMGCKMLAKLYQVQPEKLRENHRLMKYAFGLLFHDVGMIFVPESILGRSVRISDEELAGIRREIQVRGLDAHWISTIIAVNDSRFSYRATIEKRLLQELESMKVLVEQGILSEEQYAALRQFPGHSCLSDADRALLHKHPIWGWEIVRGSGFASPQALDVVRHHHQRLDLSGYPDLQVDMSLPAQIACGVDIFDALVCDRPYRQVKAYDVAFGIMDAITTTEGGSVPQLDRQVYDLLCATVEKYPVGSFVRITGGEHDGCLAQVTDYSAYNMNRPSLVIVRDPQNRRLQTSVRISRKQYDGTFHLRGLPFTDAVCDAALQEQ